MSNNIRSIHPVSEKHSPELQRDEKRSGEGLRFRESRITIPKSLGCVLKWRDFYGKESTAIVEDISRYGCRVNISKERFEYRIFQKMQRGRIEIEGVIAYEGPITFVNEKNLDGNPLSIGISLEGDGCDLDAVKVAADLRSINIDQDLQRVLSVVNTVRDSFKILVADLNTILQEVKEKLDGENVRLKHNALTDNHKMRLEERSINMAMSIYAPKLQLMFRKFREIAKEMTLDEEAVHKKYFRLNFQSLVRGTPFLDRGFSKPLGYSGDYGMMVMLYDYFDHGTSLFHKFFHRFVCSEPAAVANRNRVGFLSDILLSSYTDLIKSGATKFKVISLACGPAREIYEFLRYAPLTPTCPVEIVLVDTEEYALDYAQARLKELGTPPECVSLTFLKEDVVVGTIQQKEFLKWLDGSDFIISAGLFDYLTDRVSQRMISNLFSRLGKNGQLLIGNISKQSPDVFAMDYFMDWRLILRDELDLIRMVDTKVIDSSVGVADVVSEALGLNLFLRVRKI